jgi:hypothetical protein
MEASVPTSVLDLPVRPSREAVARLRAHPDFVRAMIASARGSVALHRNSRMANWMLGDRARALLPYVVFYLDAVSRDDDPRSGLTVSRAKALCAETGICSPGRAAACMALLQFGGFIMPAPASADRRVRRLVPSEKLKAVQRERLVRQFGAIAIVMPEVADALPLVGDAGFERAFWRHMGEQFIGGVRVLDYADLGLFAERNAGMVILFSLMLAGQTNDRTLPAGPLAIPLAEIARNFQVSRTHVLRLLRDAETAGFLAREGAPDRLRFLPPLVDALQNMFAALFLFMGGNACRAMAEARGARRD